MADLNNFNHLVISRDFGGTWQLAAVVPTEQQEIALFTSVAVSFDGSRMTVYNMNVRDGLQPLYITSDGGTTWRAARIAQRSVARTRLATARARREDRRYHT